MSYMSEVVTHLREAACLLDQAAEKHPDLRHAVNRALLDAKRLASWEEREATALRRMVAARQDEKLYARKRCNLCDGFPGGQCPACAAC